MTTDTITTTPVDEPEPTAPDRGPARAFVIALFGLGTAAAAGGPWALRVLRATLGPPEITLTIAGLAVAAAALRRLSRTTTGAWRERQRSIEAGLNGLLTFLIGVAIALPALRFFARRVIETDSARIVATVVHARNHGYHDARVSQEAILPHVIFRPALALWGLPGASLAGVLASVIFVATAAFLAWRWTRSLIAVVVAAATLLLMSFTLAQASLLPLYPLMLASGYLGAAAAWEACRSEGRRRVLFALLAALAIVAAPEFQSVGQLFFAAPLLAAIASPGGRRLVALLLTYGFIAIGMIPRLLVNYSIGGTRYIRSGRVEWMVQRGYLARINEARHETPSHLGYLRRGPELLAEALGGTGVVLIVAALLALALVPRRVQIVAVLATAIDIGGLAVQRPGDFPRYLSPLLPGIAVLIGLLVATAIESRSWSSHGRRALVHGLAVALVATIAITGSVDYRTSLGSVRAQEVARRIGRLQTMADLVGHDTVFGVRAPKLVGYNSELDPWGASWVTEQEFRNYLMWRSDRALLDMFNKYGIEYVAVTERQTLEIDYHANWLEPDYGKRPRHPRMLLNSGNFCPVWHAFPLALYRVGSCPPGVEGREVDDD